MTINANQILPTALTPLSSLAGVVYAKPNVTTNPPSCLFYPQPGTPTSIAAIYSTAASELSGGQPSNHTGWPGNTPQTALDVNLNAMGFQAGQYVAIAFNLDSTVNGDTYDYSFYSSDENLFDPSYAIEEEDSSTTLTWITGDTFQDGATPGPAGSAEGRTVVVVCPMVSSPTPSFVSFNLTIVAVNNDDPSNSTTTTIDPKVRNDNRN
jgi:hypothetical protein